MKKSWYLFIGMLVIYGACYAQQGGGGNNSTCEAAAPFCTGTLYSFPAGVNAPPGQIGPFYGCLTTRPNPAWYYMKVANSGNIIIQMHSEPSKDIDFCCWGPFTSQDCCGLLTQSKIVSCSYSTLSYETCNIPNGITGQYYMLIITNFSNQPCNIIFQQTGGTGTTDCSILPPACISNSPICSGQTLQFSAQSISGATYHWWGPAGFSSQLQNPAISNATPANSGEYFLSVIVGGQPSSDTSTTFVHVYHPLANAGNDTSILNGVTTRLHGRGLAGSGSYHYKWAPSSKLVNDSIQNPQTVNLFATQVFTLTVTDDSASCQATDMVTINIAGGALAVNAVANPSSICYGASTQIQAIGSGGAGNYTYQWTGPNGFSSTMPDPTVAPTVTSTYQVLAFDGYNTVTGSVTVTVIPLPVADAGITKSIPYGTYTFLNGSVLNGTSNYYYSWSPADKLINAGKQNPQTVNLTATTVYSLVATDLATNCISDNAADVSIEVTGGPLNVNPVATPDSICRGDSTRLHASAGGGNVGFYEYSWSSTPPGFTSADPDPMVNPLVNTTYAVTVTDQFNDTQGSIQVAIYPEPLIHLGPPDTTVCIYDTIKLSAGNPGSTYLWSNGSTAQQISFGTTGIGYDAQSYSVEVINKHGCKSNSNINVLFSFDACTGIDDLFLSGHIHIYPNPARDMVRINIDGISGTTTGSLLTTLGQVLRDFTFQEPVKSTSSVNLDLSGLPKGVYLVRFNNSTFTHIQKLVVE
ncbi:MAG: T9SS type A sorting domain-containing protein [Bacteroidetes bacterium]|nr:T9SS type A sorting domain-containing protein [Bacteroidota bacterium]